MYLLNIIKLHIEFLEVRQCNAVQWYNVSIQKFLGQSPEVYCVLSA